MPHATSLHRSGDDHDDMLIQQFLDAPTIEDPLGLNRDLEPGEKAENAVNFEDISDDDLAEDEDEEANADAERRSRIGGRHQNDASSIDLQRFTQDVDFPVLLNGNGDDDNAYDDDDDDLFGEESSPSMETKFGTGKTRTEHDQDGLSDFDDSTSPQTQLVSLPTSPLSRQLEAPEKVVLRPTTLSSRESLPSKELQRQQELLAMSRNGAMNTDGLLAPPENREELLASLWPKFKRNTIPKFMDLLPPKRARYLGKSIPKPPKPISPTKINLELALDQAKSFKLSSMPNKSNVVDGSSSQGIVTIQEEVVVEKDNEEDLDIDSDFENELFRGISWQDLQIVCEDWDICSAAEPFGSEQDSSHSRKASNFDGYKNLEPEPDPCHQWPSAKVSPNKYITGKHAHT